MVHNIIKYFKINPYNAHGLKILHGSNIFYQRQ